MSIRLIFTLLLLLVISVVWGRIIFFNAKKTYFKKICFWVMKYIPTEFKYVHSFLLGLLYYLAFLTGAIILSVVFDFNIFSYVFIESQYIPYLLVGVMAELSLSGLIIALMFTFAPKINWVNEIQNIPWIDSISYVPYRLGWLTPLLGAFCEEIFFRGFVYILLRTEFPQLGIAIPVLVSIVLFSVQQMLNTTNLKQGITMAVGSSAVATVGCLLIELTGSILPALLAHEFFVIFYFRQMDNKNGKSYVSYMDTHF